MHPGPDYDFILNADPKPKKQKLSAPSGNSQLSRILIVAGGGMVLLVVAVLVMSLLSSAGSGLKKELTRAAQQQAEIIRISEMAIERAKGTSAKNLATTTTLSLQSDQAILTEALGSQGIKVNEKLLTSGIDQRTDTVLTTAEQSNRFDEAYVETVQTQLTEYQKTLQSAYGKTDSQKMKQTLTGLFENAELLAKAKQ